MTKEDVPGAARTWWDAVTAMRATYHLPSIPRTEEGVRLFEERTAHMLSTDPTGSWVAVDEDGDAAVVGMAQAIVREDVWVLSKLGVVPRCQDQGAGKQLLDATTACGQDTARGLIFCSRDPRAARLYTRAGFELHPAVTASGHVDPRRAPRAPAKVREGRPADAAFAAELDRHLRGGAHGPDLEQVLAEGSRLLVLDDRGYAVASARGPVFLAAVDEESAADLLAAALADAGDQEYVEIAWLTAPQQWAIRIALDVGLELHPVGPVMTRGIEDGLPSSYLPNGSLG